MSIYTVLLNYLGVMLNFVPLEEYFNGFSAKVAYFV
jgi:hypothetical protein